MNQLESFFIIFSVLLIVAALAALYVAGIVWQRRDVSGSYAFLLLAFSAAIWSGGYFLELNSTQLVVKLFWARVQYFGIALAPPSMFFFAIEFSGVKRWSYRWLLPVVFAIPLIIIVLIWTNDIHHLIWQTTELVQAASGTILSFTYGPMFWVHASYTYVLLLIATVLLLKIIQQGESLYRSQAGIIFVALIAPWIGNLLYLTDLGPFPGFDMTTIGFTISSVALLRGIFKFHILDILPIAREKLVGSLPDGVIVLDTRNRVLDFNPAAVELLGVLELKVGEAAPRPLNPHISLPSRDAVTRRPQLDVSLADSDGSRAVELNVAPLKNADGGLSGKLVTIRDVSAARAAEKALRRYNTRLFVLRNIDRAILTSVSVDEIAKATLTQLRDIIRLDWIGLIQFYADQEQAVVRTFWSRKPSRLEEGFRFNSSEFEFISGITEPRKGEDAAATEPPSGPLPDYWREEGYNNFMHLPLLSGGKLIGSLGVARMDDEQFGPDDFEVVQEVAAQIAIAMQNKRLIDVTHRRALQLEVAAEIAREVASVRDLGQLLNRAVHLVSEKFGYYYVAILLNDDLLGQSILRAATGDIGRKLLVLGHQIEIGGPGLIGYTTRTARPRVALNVQDDPLYLANPLLPFTSSELTLPLIVNERIIGVLDVQSQRLSAFGEDDIPILETVASQLAIAYENARIFSMANRRADELSVLFQLSQAISGKLELEDFLETTYECVGNLMDNEAFWIASYEPGDDYYSYLIRIDRGQHHSGGQSPLDAGLGGQTILSQKPIWVEQPARKKLYRTARYGDSDPIQSAICVPLIIGDEVIGVISTQSYRAGAFGNTELELLERLAQPVAHALENVRVYTAAQRRADHLATLNGLARTMTGLFGVRELCMLVATEISARFEPYVIAIFVLDRTGQFLILEAIAGAIEGAAVPGEYTQPVGQGMIGTSARERSVILANRTRDNPNYIKLTDIEVGAELCLPLLTGGELLGVLNIDHDHEDVFDDEIVALFSTLADQLAIGLKSARLFQEVSQRADELQQLYELSTAIGEATGIDELLIRTTDLIGSQLYPDNFGFLMVDRDRQTIVTHTSYIGVPSETPLNKGVVGLVATDGQARRLQDVTQSDDYLAIDASTRSELAVPIFSADQIVGVINAERKQIDGFSEQDERLLVSVAGQIGIALERLELFAETRESLSRERQINRLGSLIGSALDLPEVLKQTVQLTASALSADAGALSLINYAGELIADYYYNIPPDLDENEEAGTGLAHKIVRQATTIRSKNYADDPQALTTWVDIGARAFLGVPVMAGSNCLGVLGFFMINTDRVFSDRDQALAENVGRQAGISVQNARLYEEVQRRARELAGALARQEELDRLKNEFIQNVSHELRTPLAIIRGYAEFLGDELGDETPQDVKMPLETIARRSIMMTSMVEDLTAILEAEQRSLKNEPVGLKELIDNTMLDFESEAEKAGIELRTTTEDGLPNLHGDPDHLRRMIDNLVSNSLKFTPEGGSVKVNLVRENGMVNLTVEDNGIGIPEPEQAHIFERFYQVDGSMSRRYGGTGLGLSLVKEIVEAHGGKIVVKSKEGQGTKFMIRLPFRSSQVV